MVTIESLRYQIGTKALVDDLTLQLEPGRVYALLGPNGAGKSTLLRIIAGEIQPTTGSIRIEGQALDSWNRTSLARRRAVLPQESGLIFDYTVEEVVALGRTPYASSPGEATRGPEVIEAALDRLELQALRGRHYTTLSGGEKQRVQLARVFTQIWDAPESGNRLLLLDEPTKGLDLSHRHSFLAEAARFAAQDSVVVISLHDPNLAFAYADEAILLRAGKLIASGPVMETLTDKVIEANFCVRSERHELPNRRESFVVIRRAGNA